VHGVDVYLSEKRGRGGDDRRDEYVLCLASLTDVASLYEPGDVVTHEGPPITEGDMCVSGEVSMMSCIFMCGSENERTTVLWYYELMFSLSIFMPKALRVYEEFSAVA